MSTQVVGEAVARVEMQSLTYVSVVVVSPCVVAPETAWPCFGSRIPAAATSSRLRGRA